ncbi:MAG: TlpA family protein disulfide reductase [Christensenellales bacterium]|jgi:thiol-disulfide isomerase/thioredoxin
MLQRTMTALLVLALMLAPAALAETEGLQIEIQSVEVGELVPEFELLLTNGETFRLSEQLGKIVIVDLWATWCPPCVDSMPQLQRIADDFPDDVVVLGVNCGDRAATVESFVERYGFTFPIAIDEDLNILYHYFPTSGIPYTVFIDAEGRLVDTHLGGGQNVYDLVKEKIEQIMVDADSTPAPAQD